METGHDRATRQSSKAVLAALTAELPELVGGSADLAGSTGTAVGGRPVTREDFSGDVLNFGIRELGMAAVLNGMSLHGGFRVYGSTFLVFSDYLRPALRLSALMRQPVVYLLTHDSVAVGEDGPTHQPVEHVESLRLIPGLTVLRPADDVETAAAWRHALATADGPTAIVLTRQAVPSLGPAPARFLPERGGRVVRDADSPDVDVLASGSEVALAVAAADLLAEQGVTARVVSVPWRERYAERSGDTPRAPLTVSVEAGVTSGWAGLATVRIGVDGFGASGKAADVLAHVGLTPHDVAARIHTALAVTPADPARSDRPDLSRETMMLTNRTTLTQFLIEERRRHDESSGEFNSLILDVALACKTISRLVAQGDLAGMLGYAGAVNVQGEQQIKLDVQANSCFLRATEWGGHVAGMVSEEIEEAYRIPAQFPRGKYLLAFDPLDGSSNVDVNVTVGSIFSITRARRARRRRQRGGLPATRTRAGGRGVRDLRTFDHARAVGRPGRARVHARADHRRVLPDPPGHARRRAHQHVRHQHLEPPVLGAGGAALRRRVPGRHHGTAGP